MRKTVLAFLLLAVLSFIPQVRADISETAFESLRQSVAEMNASMRSLQKTVASQNEVIQKQAVRIEMLENQRPVSIPQGSSSGLQAGAASGPSGAATAGISQGFNPDIGVTGTVQSKLTQNTSDTDGNDTIALKELELNFAQAVDPYSRLDAVISFNDNLENQNADIEEAYYTHWGLPWGFRGQIGKFRAKIGKENLQHLHALDTVDYAEVIKDFFGDAGLASSGARLQHDIPNPWDVPLELTGEVLRGNNGNSFSGISRRPIFNTHMKSFFDTSENTNLELGWTTMFGDENPPRMQLLNNAAGTFVETPVAPAKGQDRYGVKVFGADATFNWLLNEGRAVKFQNEIYFQNRTGLTPVNDNPWGFYSLADYRFSKRFSAGARFDYVEPLDVVGQHIRTIGISPYLTFWQSEFADFKLQYTHLSPAAADAKEDNAVYLQADFLIGAHKHPVQ